MAIENISWLISAKVWDKAGIKLTTPGSAVRQVNDCTTPTDHFVGNYMVMLLYKQWQRLMILIA